MEQVILSTRRPRRTREQISALLAKYRSSELTVTEFCKQHQLPRATFHKWISRSKQKAKPITVRHSAFAKVEVTTSMNALFAEVNGIRIYQAVSASYLKELKG